MRTFFHRHPKIWQLVKFCAVGTANTAFYYATYRLFLQALPYMAAHVVAWCCAIIFSFFLNCYVTFKVAPTWKRFLIFPSTTLANFVVTTVGAYILIEWLSVPATYGTLIASLIAIPLTFILTRLVLAPTDTRPDSDTPSPTDLAATSPTQAPPQQLS